MDSDLAKAVSKTLFWRRLGVGLAVDVLAIVIFMNVFRSEYESRPDISSYALGVGLLWIVQFALLLKSLLTAWVSMQLEYGLLADGFLETLRATKLPAPKAIYHSARFDYLLDLADDETLPANDRVKASMIYGMWKGIMQVRGTAATIILTKAWDTAAERYNRESPDTPQRTISREQVWDDDEL